MQPDQVVVGTLVDHFARACLEVFGPEAVEAVVVHGSAVKGGVIPGFSDLDVQAYLTSDQFGPYGIERDKAFAIQERIDGLGVREAGFSYFQGYFLDSRRLPQWWSGPVPETYRTAYGKLPEGAEATDETLRRSARRLLATAGQDVAHYIENIADSHDDALRRRLRLVSTSVTPTIFAAISFDQEVLLPLWAMDKFAALRVLEQRYAGDPGHSSARQFYDALLAIGPNLASPHTLRAALQLGLAFLTWVDQRLAPASHSF